MTVAELIDILNKAKPTSEVIVLVDNCVVDTDFTISICVGGKQPERVEIEAHT